MRTTIQDLSAVDGVDVGHTHNGIWIDIGKCTLFVDRDLAHDIADAINEALPRTPVDGLGDEGTPADDAAMHAREVC